MFYNEEIADSCSDTAREENPESESDTTLYISNSLNYLTGLGSGWLGNAWEKAKQQSSVAISATKRDLTEFVTTIHRDTSNAVSVVGDSALALTEKIVAAEGCGDPNDPESKSGAIGGFLENLMNRTNGSQRYTPYKDRLSALKSDSATYTTEPDACEEFSVWESTFKLDDFKDEISQLLVENSDVKKIHTKLVPTDVSYSTFWMRYFYRASLIRKDEEKSAILMNRETEYGWDSDPETPTNDRKNFNVDSKLRSPSSSISFQQVGSPDVLDVDSDDSKDSRQNGSSADSFVSIEDPGEPVPGATSTKEILEQKIAMPKNVKITTSDDSSADTSSDSIMIIDTQELDNSSPRQALTQANTKQNSVKDFINNMTIPQKPENKNEEWPEWDD